MFPTERAADAEIEEAQLATMEGVEHLGQYVFEMTGAKVKALREGAGVLPVVETGVGVGEEEDDDPGDAEDVVDAEDDELDEAEGDVSIHGV